MKPKLARVKLKAIENIHGPEKTEQCAGSTENCLGNKKAPVKKKQQPQPTLPKPPGSSLKGIIFGGFIELQGAKN